MRVSGCTCTCAHPSSQERMVWACICSSQCCPSAIKPIFVSCDAQVHRKIFKNERHIYKSSFSIGTCVATCKCMVTEQFWDLLHIFTTQDPGMITPPITEVCVNCTGDNCTFECRNGSTNNPFRINNIVNGTNYTVSLSLRNDFAQSGQTAPELYGEDQWKQFLL